MDIYNILLVQRYHLFQLRLTGSVDYVPLEEWNLMLESIDAALENLATVQEVMGKYAVQ